MKTYWTGDYKKSCFNCIHSEKDAGSAEGMYEPPEPATAICTKEYDIDEFDNSISDAAQPEDELPELCGHYEPVLVDEICVCGKELKGIEREWPHWWSTYSLIPMCSEQCVKDMEKKTCEQLGISY